ncbi:F-box domain-containing protein [Rhizoctonia solani AG-1 IA]|uniref:F-box domain-containing protein n=1 Tax=Thanatephorus cucumeris (strain AG1-IA) TaxID=983506 RepID=L8WR49_THACA|nr:F-box domain-containing protein [Rhizoctonia solani AG-1 IA]
MSLVCTHSCSREPQTFMGLPPEIIIEIINFVTPGDLVSLCRTNKSLRRMFFRKPAAAIWRTAQSNVPNLPPCPVGMAEPAYALCGTKTGLPPDPYIRVRLCVFCRDTRVRDVSKYVGADKPDAVFIPTSCSKFLRPRGRGYVDGSRGPYCLREELETGKAMRDAMKDTEGWVDQVNEHLSIVNEEATQLKTFIRTLSVSDITWKETMIKAKRERYEKCPFARRLLAQSMLSVRNKLRVLGWEQQELELSDDLKRQWDRIVDVPTPLTERSMLRPILRAPT